MEAILGPLETENMDLLPRLKFSLLRAESFPFIQVSKFLQFQVNVFVEFVRYIIILESSSR